MTLPRLLRAGSTYLVTRRCRDRRFRLRPDDEVTSLLDYLIGDAAFLSGVEVVAAVAMTNHIHLVLHDPEARLPEFMQSLCSFAARALNVHQKQVGSVWEAGSYSAVRLDTPTDVVDKIAYVIANPVAAGLVPTPEAWPGLMTLVDTLGQGVRAVERPGYFFRPEGEDGDEAKRRGGADDRPRGWSDARKPREVAWELAVPPGFEDAEDLQRQVRAALEERLTRVHNERRREGIRGFKGVKQLLRQSILANPASTEEAFQKDPRLAGKDWTRRAQACGGWVAFQLAHRAALADYRKGDRDVAFPDGTYRMRVQLGARCSGGAGA
jgi:putative transposase